MTFMLCTTVLITSDPAINKKITYSQTIQKAAIFPFCIGMVVYLSHSLLIPITNCSINPARSLGTSIVAGNFKDHVLFWVAPMTGSFLSVVIWRLLWQGSHLSRREKRDPDNCSQKVCGANWTLTTGQRKVYHKASFDSDNRPPSSGSRITRPAVAYSDLDTRAPGTSC